MKAQKDKKPESNTLYGMLVRTLQREILEGVYPVGSPLPSEATLAQRFEVSRHTVREALRTMREAGLVTSRQGAGTIVRRPGEGQGYVHHINTISDLFPKEVKTKYDPIDGAFVALPAWAARIAPELSDGGSWLRISGTRSRDGNAAPFNEVEVFVSSRFAGVGRALRPQAGPIYGLVETLYGEVIGEVTQIFGTFECDGVIGHAIGLKTGDVGIEVRRVFQLASDKTVAMISFNRYRPAGFNFSMTLRKVRD